MKRRSIVGLALPIFVVLLLALSSCENKSDDEEGAALAGIKGQFFEMIRRHNAETDWISVLDSKIDLDPVFSYQVQEALTAEPDRPYLVIVSVSDIKAWKGKYSLIGEVVEPMVWSDLYIQLSLDKVALEQFSDGPSYDEYAVIAKLHSVVSPEFHIKAEVDFNYADEIGEHALVEDSIAYCTVASDPLVVVRGECLAALNIGDFSFELMQELPDPSFDIEATR